jgi:dsDNA-specific endonuclease/ATPase MutS2
VDKALAQKKKDQLEKALDSERPDSPFDEPVVVPIEDSIDLHPFAPKDIPSIVEEYLEQCIRHDIYEIRLIHGRGSGVQRRIVRSLLEKHPLVLSFKDAPSEAGGWGATVVVLGEKS